MIEDTVKHILKHEVPMLRSRNDIALDTSFQDLDMDSLTMMELVMQVEDEFNIVIPDEVAVTFVNGKVIVDYIKKVI